MFIKYNLPAIAWALIILVLCSIPGTDIIDFSVWNLFNSDKLAHAFVFGLLNVLLIRGFSRQYAIGFLMYRPMLFATLIAIAYGGFTEVWQGIMFAYRVADINDFIADSVGCLLGIWGYRFLYFRGVV